VSDITRVLDARLQARDDPRPALQGTVRPVLQKLVTEGVLYTRDSTVQERSPTRGTAGMKMFSIYPDLPEFPWPERRAWLNELPPARDRAFIGFESEGPTAPDEPSERSRLLVSLVQELARDADEVGLLRRENSELRARLLQLERETHQLKAQARLLEKARALLRSLDEDSS
jgi:hypothetical protein